MVRGAWLVRFHRGPDGGTDGGALEIGVESLDLPG
jgi:hypothetical protein